MAITYPNQPQHWQPERTKIINGKPVRFRDVQVHEIRMGDVEDPDLYAAEPLWQWQNSEQGKWVMEHSIDPTFHINPDPLTFGYSISITAHITPKRWTEFCLRWA